MIYGNINNLGNLNVFPEQIRKGLQYILENDCANMEAGKYEIEGKDIFVQVMDANADIISKKRPEVHKNYIDLQFTPNGGEIFGYANDNGNNEVDEDLFEIKDIKYYKAVENEIFIKTIPGDFFVFFPWDIHRPGGVEEGPKIIRKVVVKIKLNTI